MKYKKGIVLFVCVFATACGSVTIQTVPNLTKEARSLFANLVEASPRVRGQNILLVIADSKEEKEAFGKNLRALDCAQDQIFEKTIVLTKRQLDRFQKILSFVIAHKIAHILLSELGIAIDSYSLELWSDRLGFQLVVRTGENPKKIIENVCEFFRAADLSGTQKFPATSGTREREPTGEVRCEFLRQLYRLNLFDSPASSTGN